MKIGLFNKILHLFSRLPRFACNDKAGNSGLRHCERSAAIQKKDLGLNKRSKIGLLGGSFNPPHAGHLHISDLALKHLNLDKIWWIPTALNPLKDPKIYENYENRLEKCQILTKNHPKIEIHPFDEIYTIKLVKKLKTDFSDDFIWIMGADNFERLHEWDNLIDLIKIIPFAVFSRENFLEKIAESQAFKMIKNANLENNLKIFETENLNISSTQIRNNV